MIADIDWVATSSIVTQSPIAYGSVVLMTMPAKTSLSVLWMARPSTMASAPDVATSPRTGNSSTNPSAATAAARKTTAPNTSENRRCFLHARGSSSVSSEKPKALLIGEIAQRLREIRARQGRVILGGDASFSLIHRRLSPDEAGFLGRKAFPAAGLGGFGSIPGALAGGLIIGVAETLSGFYLPEGFKDVAAYILLLVVLMVRPEGLFGLNLRKKV